MVFHFNPMKVCFFRWYGTCTLYIIFLAFTVFTNFYKLFQVTVCSRVFSWTKLKCIALGVFRSVRRKYNIIKTVFFLWWIRNKILILGYIFFQFVHLSFFQLMNSFCLISTYFLVCTLFSLWKRFYYFNILFDYEILNFYKIITHKVTWVGSWVICSISPWLLSKKTPLCFNFGGWIWKCWLGNKSVTFTVWRHNCKWKINAYMCTPVENMQVCVTFSCTIN